VKSYVLDHLAKLKSEVKEIDEGVYRVDLGKMGLFVCFADYCIDKKFLARDWASDNTPCYIVVNPKNFEERFLKEDWLICIPLADIVSGEIDFKKLLVEASNAESPREVLKASVPVYTKEAFPIVEPIKPSKIEHKFIVEVGPEKIVRVEGEIVVAPQAGTGYHIFRILWDRFLDDLKEGRLPKDFRPINLDQIAEELQELTGEYFEDVSTIRRNINRLQSDIEKAIKKKAGPPIDKGDIIQTCPSKSQTDRDYGYRLNPFTVAVRPFQSNKT